MTLKEYYDSFESLLTHSDALLFLPSGIECIELQNELINSLSEKDRYDFYRYVYELRKTPPDIWKKIYKSLPLYNLFVHSKDKHLNFLYNKYRHGDKAVFNKLGDLK